MSWNFQKTVAKTASATLVAADAEDWCKVTPAAATTITLPALKDYSHPQALKISNEDGAYAVTITANTSKPDYIVTRKAAEGSEGKAVVTFTSIQLSGAADYVILSADPIMGYWYIVESGLAADAVGAIAARQEYNITSAVTSSRPGVDLVYNNISTDASGIPLSITAYQNAVMTGYWAGAIVNMYFRGTTSYAEAFSVYAASTGNPTVSWFAPFSCYIDDLGTACEALVGLDLGFALSNATSGRYTYHRYRAHASATPLTVFLMEGPCAKYLMNFGSASEFYDTGQTAGTECIGHLKVHIGGDQEGTSLSGGATAYINLYTDNS